MNVSVDTQETIVSALMKSSYLFSICKSEVSDGYFSSPSCKVIYKALTSYYNKYKGMPRLNELLISIDECYYPTCGVNLSEVKDTCCRLWDLPEPDELFIKDKITDFVRKVRSSSALKEFVDQLKVNPNLESDSVVSDLVKALEVQFSTTKVFSMTDPEQVKTVRQASVGSMDQGKIIHSFIESLNQSLMFGGFQPSTVNMIVSPPGCFTGDTKIMTLDGESHTLQELYDSSKSPGIYGSSEDGEIKVGMSDCVYLSEYVDELVEVEIDNKYVIKCTPDHPFMLRDGNYRNAEDLSVYDELMPIKREYRTANQGGSALIDKNEGYECVVNGDGVYWYTHRLSAELIPHLEEETVRHHIDHNKLNNYPENIQWMTNKDHCSYHYNYNFEHNEKFREGSLKGRIKPGEHRSPHTEFTSEDITQRNLCNWKDPEYRNRMREVSRINGKNSMMTTTLNYDKDFQDKTQRGKILSFINRLMIEFPDVVITESNYDQIASRSTAKRKVWMKGIRKYFDCDFNDILMQAKDYNHKVTKITKVKLEEKVPVYGVVEARPFGNYAIALNDLEGVFVSNTGKSMYLINEGVSAAKQGFEVLHVFIGDMVEYDGFIRYLSRVSGTPQNSLVMMPPEKQMSVVDVCNQQYNNLFTRITMISYPSLSITVDALVEDINKFEKQLEKDFDMIIIDYPDNLILDGRSLYEDGGTLYSSLEKLSRLSKSVVLVASQPQKSFWNHQIIPLEAAAESSKKQQAVDIMLTMNTESRGAPFGTMLLAKARKGEVGKIFRFKTDYSKCLIEEVNESEFQALKASYGQIQ